LPDFERISEFEAKGLTVKDAWLDYAKSCSQPYTYAHFSTLYKVWFAGQAETRNGRSCDGDYADPIYLVDYTADEDHISELYWKRKSNPRSAVHGLSGFNCSLKVRNDELVAFDSGEERLFRKVNHGLQAIAFLGEGGNITIDAIKWCEAQGVGICVIG
jgi:hypothetical protein